MREPKKKTVRALVLFSGGLDSILAVKILEEQGIRVTTLTFESYFFDAEQAKKSARDNKIKLKTADFSAEHFKVIKNPRFGRGGGMNPCVDCHLLMFIQAKILMKKEKYDFIATGEVLGQRPMSQNARALTLIEKKAGLQGKILRPLSEKILHPRAELSGGMYGISGRGRKEQMELAKKYKIKNYPTPAGGCILTDKEYSRKLRELFSNVKNIKSSDLALLKIGRHFWIGKSKIILGRNHQENLALKKMAKAGDILIDPKNFPGSTALVRGKEKKKTIETAKEKIIEYSKKFGEKAPTFSISRK